MFLECTTRGRERRVWLAANKTRFFARFRSPQSDLDDRDWCLYLPSRPYSIHLRPSVLLLGWGPFAPVGQPASVYVGFPGSYDAEFRRRVRRCEKYRCSDNRVHGRVVRVSHRISSFLHSQRRPEPGSYSAPSHDFLLS